MPLKVDTASPEYQQLQRKHQSEGNTIPKIFVIRADGKKLYAKSGALSGDQLPTLMVAAVREMGRPLNVKESELLTEINASITSSMKSNDFRSAMNEFRKVKKLGQFGQINSYAKAAIENNLLAESLVETINKQVSAIRASVETPSDETFSNLVDAVALKSAVGTVPQLKVSINQLDKLIRTNEATAELYPIAKKVSAASQKLSHKSSRVVASAQKILRDISSNDAPVPVTSYVDDLLKSSKRIDAELHIEEKSDLAGVSRKWTSADGKFSIDASFLKNESGVISLRKANGDVIKVPLKQLSQADREWIAKSK